MLGGTDTASEVKSCLAGVNALRWVTASRWAAGGLTVFGSSARPRKADSHRQRGQASSKNKSKRPDPFDFLRVFGLEFRFAGEIRDRPDIPGEYTNQQPESLSHIFHQLPIFYPPSFTIKSKWQE